MRGKNFFWLCCCALGVFSAFLLSCHYVKGYSDPAHWIAMAERLVDSGELPPYSVLFAGYLIVPLKLLELHAVFLSNLPWILVLVVLTGVVTAKCCGSGTTIVDQRSSTLCGFLTVLAFIHIHAYNFLELLNPYREPLAFSLLMGCFVCLLGYPRRQRTAWVAAAGALFGLATGMREPLAIAGGSVFLLYLGYLYRDHPRHWLRPVPWFLAGCVVGLMPFFVHNELYGGHWWVPAYVYDSKASLREGMNELESWFPVAGAVLVVLAIGCWMALRMISRYMARLPEEARLACYRRFVIISGLTAMVLMLMGLVAGQLCGVVPGATWDRFRVTGGKTLIYLFEKLGLVGVVLLAAGGWTSVRRKWYALLLLTVPSTLAFLFFWSFYAYVKPRYVFSAEIFIYPLVGAGLAGLLSGVAQVTRSRIKSEKVLMWLVGGVIILVTGRLAWDARRGSDRLKVWHLSDIREQLAPVLEEPYVFDCGRNHYGELLSIVVGPRLIDHYRNSQKTFALRGVQKTDDQLSSTLSRLGSNAMARAQQTRLYSYEPTKRCLVRQWFDYVPILKLENLTPPLEHYGKRMDDWLFELRPWKETRVSRRIQVADQGPHLLALDPNRIWDYPERTFCHLLVNGRIVSHSLSNNFQFIEVDFGEGQDAQTGTASLELISDAGLPRSPYVSVTDINEPILLAFGATDKFWYRPYLSSSLIRAREVNRKCCVLTRKGEIRVPSFATPDRDVFVRFYLEFYQEDAFFRRAPHFLELRCAGQRVEVPLPGRRRRGTVVAGLGRGSGRLVMPTVSLSTTLPSRDDQREMRRTSRLADLGYVKISGAKVWTLPRELRDAHRFTIAEIEPFLGEGFYPVEHQPAGMRCWSGPRAVVDLPPMRGAEAMDIVIETVVTRPAKFSSIPEFRLNGRQAATSILDDEAGRRRYLLSKMVWRRDAVNKLELSMPPWNPHADSGVADLRDLGILLSGIEIRRPGTGR